MRACIMSIGSEIMLGEITDTNAAFLARELTEAGIDVVMVTQVGDDAALLAAALRRSIDVADVVICTGGIGPTDDDLTRETIAEVIGERPEIDPDLLVELEGYFAQLGRVMPARNRKQAWLIPSAESLANPIGTAPGWFVRHDDTMIVTMPGVPREMIRMWTEQAKPRILAAADRTIIDTVNLRTIGIGESDAEERIHDLIRAGDPQVATYAKDDGVQIRVTAHGTDADETRARRDEVRDVIMERLGQYVWGTDADTLPVVIARSLAERGITLTVREIGTGGALASLFSSDPTSARAFVHDDVFPAGADVAPTVGANPSVELRFEGDRDDHGVYRGITTMRLVTTDARQALSEQWQIRGSYADIQRRSALNAMFALYQWATTMTDMSESSRS